MSLKLRHKVDGSTILWDFVGGVNAQDPSDDFIASMLPEFIKRDYEVVKGDTLPTLSGKILTPKCGWDKLTLENYEVEMGQRFRIDHDQSMRGITREVAFLELLESKGVKRSTKLVEGLTLENFAEKMNQRFRMAKVDKERGLSRERAFQEWRKRNGY
jgi:23S rRNA U2552 (ribose-2'-O)-methylase RlmE/FtsJ